MHLSFTSHPSSTLPPRARRLPLLALCLVSACGTAATEPDGPAAADASDSSELATITWQPLPLPLAGNAGTALVARPRSAPASARVPTAIYFHPAPGAWGVARLQELAATTDARWRPLLDLGYAVILADYRAGSMNDRASVLGASSSMLADAKAVVAAVGGLSFVEPTRIALLGGSLGGLLALLTAAETTAPRALVLDYPATTLWFDASVSPPPRCQLLTEQQYDRARVLSTLAALRATPPLLVQGSADGLCGLNLTLDNSLRAAGVPVTLQLLPGEPHLFTNDPGAPDYGAMIEVTTAYLAARR